MSIQAINWCIEQKGLPPAEWVVLFHLCHAHNPEYGCFPSQEFLSEHTGMSSRSMVRHMSSLEAKGLLIRARRYDGNVRVSDRYHFPFEDDFEAVGANLAGANSCIGKCQTVHTQVPTVAPTYEAEQVSNSKEQVIPPVSPKSSKPQKARLPEGWVPTDEDRDYALSLNLNDEEIQEIADDFHAYWTDRTDAGGRKSARGWRQTWRNRCRDVAPRFIRNRRMAGNAYSGGHGQGGGIAGVVARRQFGGPV